MLSDISHCIDIYRQNRYEYISEKMMDVDSHNVTREVKKGRVLLLCDCTNHTKFCNEQSICRHKLFFLLYPLLNNFSTKIKILLEEYKESYELTKEKKEQEIFFRIIDDLESLRRKLE